MAKAEIQEVLPVSKKTFFATITRYEDYPQFVEGCTSVQVERKGAGRARAAFQVDLMKDVSYTLDMLEDEVSGTVSWTLVDSNFFKKNTGQWQLKEAGDGKCDVTYFLDVEFKVPVPGFILNRIVKGSLPKMLKNFESQARKHRGKANE